MEEEVRGVDIYIDRLAYHEPMLKQEQDELFAVLEQARAVRAELADAPESQLEPEHARLLEGGTAARERLITSNLRLVPAIIHDTTGIRKYDSQDRYDDLLQLGNELLIRAVDSYERSFDTAFTTYAYSVITPRVREFLAQKNHMGILPPHVRLSLQKLQKAARELKDYLGRSPTAAELATATGFSENKVMAYRDINHALAGQSLDEQLSSGSDESEANLHDVVADKPEDVLAGKLKLVVESALSKMSERDQAIVAARVGYGEDDYIPSLRELGVEFGISRQAVLIIQEKGFSVLRQAIRRQFDDHELELSERTMRQIVGRVKTRIDSRSKGLELGGRSIEQALEGMPRYLRELGRLAFDGQGRQIRTPAEIAEITGSPARSVRTNLSLIRRTVRDSQAHD